MENITMTRISDLPDLGQQGQGQGQVPGSSNNYQPMLNVHPNPYGISDKNPIIDLPQDTNMQQLHQSPPQQLSPPISNQLSDADIAKLNAMQQQRLPSRDIPHDTTTYSQDEAVQPNYIPKPKDLDDYVREHEKTTEKNSK